MHEHQRCGTHVDACKRTFTKNERRKIEEEGGGITNSNPKNTASQANIDDAKKKKDSKKEKMNALDIYAFQSVDIKHEDGRFERKKIYIYFFSSVCLHVKKENNNNNKASKTKKTDCQA